MTTNQPETPNNRIDRLEATLTRFAELSFQSYRQHDEAPSRLEANDTRHDEALFRIEGAISELTSQQQQLSRNVDNLNTTLVEVLQIAGDQARAIANNNQRIEQILEYLFRQSGNGRGGNGGQTNT